MKPWLVYSVMAFFCWSVSTLFPKISVKYVDPKSAIIYQLLGYIVVGTAITLSPGFHLILNHKGLIFAALSGLLGMLGALFYYKAVNITNVSTVVVFTGLYPFCTVLLSLIFLKETLTVKQIVGMIFAFISMILLSIK